jgi:anti-sigma B factor antagonist
VELIQKEESGIVFITIKGRLDGSSAPEAEETVNEVLERGIERLLFNLDDLDYLSSAGLRIILGAAKEMRRREGKFVLCSLNSYVKEVFEVSGFGAIIPIAESVEEGIKEIS